MVRPDYCHLRVKTDRVQQRLIQSGYSFLSSNDMRAHFGFGAKAEYDSITVVWPDGTTEQFPGGMADRFVTIDQGTGQILP